MQFLRADTTKIVRLGPAVDISDGYTLLSTLDISTADYAYMMHGDSVEVDISSNTWAAITNVTGWYDLTLTDTQLTTEGPMTIAIYDVSLCLPVYGFFHVVNANVYDSLFAAAATDYLDINVAQWLGTAAATPTTAGVPEVDVTYLAGNGTAATNLSQAMRAAVPFTVGTGSQSDTIETNLAEATANHYNGKICHFFTGNLAGQSTNVTGYDGSGTLSVTALTEAPSNGDFGILL